MNKEEYNKEEELDEKKTHFLERRKRIQRMYFLCLAMGIIFISIGLGQLLADILCDAEVTLRLLPQQLCLILLIYGIMMICAVAPMTRARLRTVEEEIQDIEFETDLLRLKATPEESRAEKLLRMNQLQLRRYYDLNLSQNSWIFGVGIVCILLGAGITGVTVYLLTSPGSAALELEEKVVLGLLGAVGTILTDYVAAIYLKMHSTTSESLNTFHSKLVSTNTLFLANLIASRIDDVGKREDTLSKLAMSVLGRAE